MIIDSTVDNEKLKARNNFNWKTPKQLNYLRSNKFIKTIDYEIHHDIQADITFQVNVAENSSPLVRFEIAFNGEVKRRLE